MFPDNYTNVNGISNSRRGFLMGNAIVNIEIYSLQGQRILVNKNGNTINVSKLTSGTYFLRITDDNNGIHNIKFIKE